MVVAMDEKDQMIMNLARRVADAEAEISRLRSANVAFHDDNQALYRRVAMAETENRNLRGANAAANAIIAQQAVEMKCISDEWARAQAINL